MWADSEKNQTHLAASRAVGWAGAVLGPLFGLPSLTGRVYQRLTGQVLHEAQTWHNPTPS